MAGDMRIVMIGQEAFGGKVLEALTEQGENVVGAFVPPDREGRPLGVSMRSSSLADCSSNCAAPRMPDNGFLISCARTPAMPTTERAAPRWVNCRSIL